MLQNKLSLSYRPEGLDQVDTLVIQVGIVLDKITKQE